MVEPVYVRQSWVKKRLSAWTEECIKAGTAAAVEKLTKVCGFFWCFCFCFCVKRTESL